MLLAEKNLAFDLVVENFWERRREFARLNPAMQVPVLVDISGDIIADSNAIGEYIESLYPDPVLLGTSVKESAEIRRLVAWFDHKFYNEVGRYLLNEKVIRYVTRVGEPCSDAIRAAKANLTGHMEYIKYLTRHHKWLTGETMTLADITAAAHLSIIDFLGEVPWDAYPSVKEWYVFAKSRPSFRPLLQDRMVGYVPPLCYADLDF